jgi:chemotaxis protein histidine kinase CheA
MKALFAFVMALAVLSMASAETIGEGAAADAANTEAVAAARLDSLNGELQSMLSQYSSSLADSSEEAVDAAADTQSDAAEAEADAEVEAEASSEAEAAEQIAEEGAEAEEEAEESADEEAEEETADEETADEAADEDESDEESDAELMEEAEELVGEDEGEADDAESTMLEIDALDTEIDADVDAVFLQIADTEEEEGADETEAEGSDAESGEAEADAEGASEAEAELDSEIEVAVRNQRNVDPAWINVRHTAKFGGVPNPAFLSVAGADTRTRKLKGKKLSVKASPVFDASGRRIGRIAAQSVGGRERSGVVAGAIATVNNEIAVLGYRLKSKSGRRVTGWVPATAFSHTPEVIAFTKTSARALDKVRPLEASAHAHRFRVHQRSGVAKRWKSLYTHPNQKKGSTRKLAKRFFANKRRVVKMLMNVPTGGNFKGIPLDVVPADSEFSRIRGVESVSVPLYRAGQTTPDKKWDLKFVYGFFVNAAGEKRFGWMPLRVLGN